MAPLQNDDIIHALELTGSAVLITDPGGVIRYASPAIRGLTGYTPEELIGQHTRIFKSDLNPPPLYEDMWETILAKQRWSGLLRNLRKDGSTYLEYMTITPVVNSDGAITHFAAVKNEAGEHAEDNPPPSQHEHVENESVLETVVNLASEFQSSLQMVLGFAQILEDDLEDHMGGSQREYFDIVVRTVQRLLRTLDDTVLLARLESDVVQFKPAKLNVAEELKEILSKIFPLRDTEQVRFIRVIEDNGAEIFVDRQSFSTVISHLVINAMKFTKEGSITVGLQTQNNQAVVWVIDTGVGISEQFKPNLFASFKQEELGFHKDFEGAGLGLAIARNLVSKMGGSMTFESYKGSGSTFIVSFPIAGWEDRVRIRPS